MALYCRTPHYRLLQPVAPQSSKLPSKPYRTLINIQVLAETHFDNYDFELSLSVFHEQRSLCPDSSLAPICFNIAQIHLHLGERIESESWFLKAISIDPYLAVAFFQLGAVHVGLGQPMRARGYYESCYSVITRGSAADNADVEYDQLGLRYKLRVADVEANIRLCAAVEAAANGNSEEWVRQELAIPRAVVMVPAGTIFRAQSRKRKARAEDPAETAEWRFRDEARVIAEVPEQKLFGLHRGGTPHKKW